MSEVLAWLFRDLPAYLHAMQCRLCMRLIYLPCPLPCPSCRCIGVNGPDGRREVRALTFTSTGSALLAAYPDGLRTFTIDPLEHRDTAELAWKEVGRYEGPCIDAGIP